MGQLTIDPGIGCACARPTLCGTGDPGPLSLSDSYKSSLSKSRRSNWVKSEVNFGVCVFSLQFLPCLFWQL